VFCLLAVLVRLSVPVQVIDWKDSSPKWPIMCWCYPTHSCTHSLTPPITELQAIFRDFPPSMQSHCLSLPVVVMVVCCEPKPQNATFYVTPPVACAFCTHSNLGDLSFVPSETINQNFATKFFRNNLKLSRSTNLSMSHFLLLPVCPIYTLSHFLPG